MLEKLVQAVTAVEHRKAAHGRGKAEGAPRLSDVTQVSTRSRWQPQRHRAADEIQGHSTEGAGRHQYIASQHSDEATPLCFTRSRSRSLKKGNNNNTVTVGFQVLLYLWYVCR